MPSLSLDVRDEGIVLNELLDGCMPKEHFFGHYHRALGGKHADYKSQYATDWRCVEIVTPSGHSAQQLPVSCVEIIKQCLWLGLL